MAQLAHGGLAVLRRIADVARVGADDVGEAALQRIDDAARVVDRQRGLRHIGDRRIDAADRASSTSASRSARARTGAGNLPDRAFDFRMARVSDQDQRAALARHTAALDVNLGDERAGGVEHVEPARSAASASTLLRHAVRAEDHDRAVAALRRVPRRNARPCCAGSRRRAGCARSRGARRRVRRIAPAPDRRFRSHGPRPHKSRGVEQG